MNKYICYIYYNEDWEPYYVGKGSEFRRIYTTHGVTKAGKNRTQVFYFANEWEAFECERELIAFWGRECDGGCLKNKSIGGSNGPIGCKLQFSEDALERLRKLCASHSKAKRKSITVRCIETGEIRAFECQREMERQLNICRRNLQRTGKTKGWELV